jgi:hypothetical protein
MKPSEKRTSTQLGLGKVGADPRHQTTKRERVGAGASDSAPPASAPPISAPPPSGAPLVRHTRSLESSPPSERGEDRTPSPPPGSVRTESKPPVDDRIERIEIEDSPTSVRGPSSTRTPIDVTHVDTNRLPRNAAASAPTARSGEARDGRFPVEEKPTGRRLISEDTRQARAARADDRADPDAKPSSSPGGSPGSSGSRTVDGRPIGGKRADSGRPESGRPASARPASGRPASGRPESGRPASAGSSRPESGRPASGRPASGRPESGRPAASGRSSARPASIRPPGRSGAPKASTPVARPSPSPSPAPVFTKSARPSIREDNVGAAVKADAMGGSGRSVPRLLKTKAEIAAAPIDHRAGFLLAHVDGVTTVAGLVDICGMPEEEVDEILDRLRRLGIVAVR